MSATHRAEVDRRWQEFVTQIRGCRVQGECQHCDMAVSAFRRWAEGREDAACICGALGEPGQWHTSACPAAPEPLLTTHAGKTIDARENRP